MVAMVIIRIENATLRRSIAKLVDRVGAAEI
jgi:hypothetical protein